MAKRRQMPLCKLYHRLLHWHMRPKRGAGEMFSELVPMGKESSSSNTCTGKKKRGTVTLKCLRWLLAFNEYIKLRTNNHRYEESRQGKDNIAFRFARKSCWRSTHKMFLTTFDVWLRYIHLNAKRQTMETKQHHQQTDSQQHPESSLRFIRLNPRFDRQETLDLLQVRHHRTSFNVIQ